MSYKVSTIRFSDGSKDYRYTAAHATTLEPVVFIIRKTESNEWACYEVTSDCPDGEWANTYSTKKVSLEWALRQLAGQ